MSFSIRHSFKYPFEYPVTRHRLIVMVLLSLVPFGDNFLLSPFATACASALTIERQEDAPLDVGLLLGRSLRACIAAWLTCLYALPGIIGISLGVHRYFQHQSITWPLVALAIYGFLVLAAVPLATLHAVTTQNALNALHLPKLLWISLKVDLKTTMKMLVGSMLLLAIKMGVGFISLVGLGFILSPVKAYSEYVFQYFLAASYVAAFKK